jgi:glyceraldehyde 3-phosphate dehydrogenase
VTADEVREVFRSAAQSDMKSVLSFTEDPIVSADARKSTASCLFDSLAAMVVQGNMVKTLGWYAQDGCIAHRIVDLIEQLAPRTTQLHSEGGQG